MGVPEHDLTFPMVGGGLHSRRCVGLSVETQVRNEGKTDGERQQSRGRESEGPRLGITHCQTAWGGLGTREGRWAFQLSLFSTEFPAWTARGRQVGDNRRSALQPK